MEKTNFSFIQKILAWSVHLFTASGLVAGFLAILAINEKDWRLAMTWLIIALIIDGIDGTFARLFQVKKVLPHVDGKTMDYVIDFATYAIIPAYFFYEAELVTEFWRFPCTTLILLVSSLYYAIDGMVSADNYFIGFPVLWNMVVFYMIFIVPPNSTFMLFAVFAFALLHFIPIKFAYPSQNNRLFIPTIIVTVLFFVMLLSNVYFYPEQPQWMKALGYLCAAYYGLLAIYDTWIVKID